MMGVGVPSLLRSLQARDWAFVNCLFAVRNVQALMNIPKNNVRAEIRVRVRFQIDQRALVIRPLAPPNIPKIVGLSKE